MNRPRATLSLAALLAAAVACGPEFVYDNPCDPASDRFDPCACEGCFEATCQRQEDTCACTHPAGRCGDGAAGSCCAAGAVCRRDAAGQELDECCTPSCAGRVCGDDGCGGKCGGLAPDPCGSTCVDGQWIFSACDGRECGDNGCGGSCGTCPGGGACSEAGLCVAGS